MSRDIYSFFDLVSSYTVKIPIIQRDYAQGREQNIKICESFLLAIKESMAQKKRISLDFIYGNVQDDVFLPLDGQQRLSTLFLLHWYAFTKESRSDSERAILKRFSYETRLSSRRFCDALVENGILIDMNCNSISEQICNSEWFFLSWESDPTIRAMLRTIDLIHSNFLEVNNICDALVSNRMVVFHLLILENFGLSDDLYIKMNARGRLLTPFENLKAEIQDKATRDNWEMGIQETEKFCYKIDGPWTDFLWKYFRKDNSVDNAHIKFITTIIMAKLPVKSDLKGTERDDIIQKLNGNNANRELIQYIDKEIFNYLYRAYEMYCNLSFSNSLPNMSLVLWRHKPERNLLYQILLGYNTSYTHKVLFYAQTEYLMRNQIINIEKYTEWMRVVRNIVSRADTSRDGKRSDLIRDPTSFSGAINLIQELAVGCGDIYAHLCKVTITSSFAHRQMGEEVLKARIMAAYPIYKELIFDIEDNELLRGSIIVALECAGYKTKLEQIDFETLEKVCEVFKTYFNKELPDNALEFDKLRRAMLTMNVDGEYHFYNYWKSLWYATDPAAEKRKLFSTFREIEYVITRDPEHKKYFIALVLALTKSTYDELIASFVKPNGMENWQYRLIKEDGLLAGCEFKYIAISQDRMCCYLLKGKRPSDLNGCFKIS